MAAEFARRLKRELAKYAPGIPVKIFNSPKAAFDTSRTVAICCGKKFTREIRVADEAINKFIIAKQIANANCVFIFTRNTSEIMDCTTIDVAEYAPKTGRWITKYGFSKKSTCTVCLDDGIDNNNLVICDHCQAPVCVSCFARCVRTSVATRENIPPEFKCPTCSTRRFTFEMLGKELLLFPTGESFRCPWDMIDYAVNSIRKIPDGDEPKIYIAHPRHPFNYHGDLRCAHGACNTTATEIATDHGRQVNAMLTTPGSLICVGDIPMMTSNGRESCHRSGPRDVTNGRAFVYEDGVYSEIRNGFPIVLSCFYNL